jgi:hypothetical protein
VSWIVKSSIPFSESKLFTCSFRKTFLQRACEKFELNYSTKTDSWYFKRRWDPAFRDIRQVCLLFADFWWLNGHRNNCACGVTIDFEVFEELVYLNSVQGQTKELDFIQVLLFSFEKKIWNYVSLWTQYWSGAFFFATNEPIMSVEWINTVSSHYPSTEPKWQSRGI